MRYVFFSLLLLLSFFSTIQAQNKPGTLDKSFGEGGRVITSFKDGSFQCYNAAKAPDGKIVTSGTFYADRKNFGFLAVRYLPNGMPDYSFGDSGKVVTNLGYDNQQPIGLAVQKDGKVIVAGYVVSSNFGDYTDIAIVRYNADGSPDQSFGKKGIVISDFGKNDYAYAAAVQEDGKIVIAGNNQRQYFLAARYLPNGTLDTSFGTNGAVITDMGGLAYAYAVQIQPDGRIILAGNQNTIFALVRYLPDGALDKSFGSGGKVKTDFPSGTEGIEDIALQKNGSIVAAGKEENRFTNNMNLVQYTPNGRLDSSFGTAGKTTLYFDDPYSLTAGVDIDNDGKIVLFGTISSDASIYRNIVVARFGADGTPDSSFADNGRQLTSFGIPSATAVAGFIDDNGKIVMAGLAVESETSQELVVILARYNSDTKDQPLAIRIKRWLQHHGISWQGSSNIRYYAVQRSPDGIVYKEIAKLLNTSNTYEDATALTGSSYYRLAAIAKDGSRTYSNTVLIDESAQVKMFPNPVKDNLQLQGLPSTGKTNISIIDINGVIRTQATATGSAYSINTAMLQHGHYLVKLQHGDTITILPFVKE